MAGSLFENTVYRLSVIIDYLSSPSPQPAAHYQRAYTHLDAHQPSFPEEHQFANSYSPLQHDRFMTRERMYNGDIASLFSLADSLRSRTPPTSLVQPSSDLEEAYYDALEAPRPPILSSQTRGHSYPAHRTNNFATNEVPTRTGTELRPVSELRKLDCSIQALPLLIHPSSGRVPRHLQVRRLQRHPICLFRRCTSVSAVKQLLCLSGSCLHADHEIGRESGVFDSRLSNSIKDLALILLLGSQVISCTLPDRVSCSSLTALYSTNG